MKAYKITFWVIAVLIFVLEGVLSILTSQSKMAIDGVTHLGYPVYFSTLLAVFKFLGGLALVIPQVPRRVKEWAFAGFGIDFISAFVSNVVVDGFTPMSFPALLAIVLLVVCYISYNKFAKPTLA